MTAFLRALLGDVPPAPIDAVGALRAAVEATSGGDTVEQAATLGRRAATPGWAFAGGYEAALRRLCPSLPAGALGALCVTEQGGGHPKAMRATLAPAPDGRGLRLAGDKTFVTLGADADLLLVVATEGTDDAGRNRLRVASVPASRAGVTLVPMPPLPFAPEIGHARVELRDVAVDARELLPGDGYDAVVKPFRTIEDLHVTAAWVGWALGLARAHAWPRAWQEQAAAALVGLRALGGSPPSAPETHVALAGELAAARRLLDDGAWQALPERARAVWERDRGLLDVAGKARAARLESAWAALGARPRD